MKFVLILISILSFSSFAQGIPACKNLDDLAIQQGGRIKPLYVHSYEAFKYLTGKTKFNGETAPELYCRLSLSAFMEVGEIPVLNIRVDHVELKNLLNFKKDQKTISMKELSDNEDLMRMELRKLQDKETSYKKSLNRAFGKLMTHKSIANGSDWMLPVKTNSNQIEWLPVGSLLTNPNYQGLKNNLPKFFETLKKDYLEIENDKHHLELFYYKSNVYRLSIALVILNIFLLVIFRNSFFPIAFAGINVLIQLGAIIIRIMISGRAPITNMYETVLFSGFGALVIAMIIGHIRKDRNFILGGLGYNILCLFMLVFANGMLTREISPLVPVLRDNFWLSTHVTSVILSYAAFAISWVLANILLFKRSFSSVTKAEYRYQTDLIYSSLKVGTTLLAGGIILGGVWADYSWGRFWGWDPKETWSAIALLIYLAILHGKYTSWIKDEQFVPAVAAAFMSIMMAWFGVNYILASGLHSYGFSEGGAIFLGSFFAVQTAIIILSQIKKNEIVSV